MNKEVTILGAGITGVSLGKHLTDENIKVTVIEKTDKLGGMASSFKRKNNEKFLRKQNQNFSFHFSY